MFRFIFDFYEFIVPCETILFLKRLIACYMLSWCPALGFHRVMLEITERIHIHISKIISHYSAS